MKKSRNVFLMFVIGAVCLSLFVACSSGIVSGPVQITLIRPTAEHCKYEITPTQVQTLQNISEMRGLIGSVVTTNENLDKHPEILDTGIGFKPVDAQFIRSGNVYGPIDISTLFAASL